jgi:hypothetical protein
MTKQSFSKVLARSALISIFLATSAQAQFSLPQPPEQFTISIISIPSGNGVFTPAVQVVNALGQLTHIPIGQDGLTRAILYNRGDITAWVLERFGTQGNARVIYEDISTSDDQEDAAPVTTPETPPVTTPETPHVTPPVTEPDPPTSDDCLPSSAVKTVDDLPIVSVAVNPCHYDPCTLVRFDPEHKQSMLWRVNGRPCDPIDIPLDDA